MTAKEYNPFINATMPVPTAKTAIVGQKTRKIHVEVNVTLSSII